MNRLLLTALVLAFAAPAHADNIYTPKTPVPAPSRSRFAIGFANIKDIRGAVFYTAVRASNFDFNLVGAENVSNRDVIVGRKTPAFFEIDSRRHLRAVDTVNTHDYDWGFNPAMRLGRSNLDLGIVTFHRNGSRRTLLDPRSYDRLGISLSASI